VGYSRQVGSPVFTLSPSLHFPHVSSSLLGGGVHDKKIRFYNTFHGTLLSSLDVDAQITTLIWSPNTTEILATFGYTAPGTSTKCAVYAYPSLQCLFAFEIADEIRALYAVVSPNGQDICLAGSDECVRFYRIWGNNHDERDTSPVRGLIEGVDTLLDSENNGTEGRGLLRYELSVIR
jgi:WD40 repeat protein